MTKTVRARYTLEFKQEAVRLVHGGQSIAAAARTLGVVEQTLFNWVKAIPLHTTLLLEARARASNRREVQSGIPFTRLVHF